MVAPEIELVLLWPIPPIGGVILPDAASELVSLLMLDWRSPSEEDLEVVGLVLLPSKDELKE